MVPLPLQGACSDPVTNTTFNVLAVALKSAFSSDASALAVDVISLIIAALQGLMWLFERIRQACGCTKPAAASGGGGESAMANPSYAMQPVSVEMRGSDVSAPGTYAGVHQAAAAGEPGAGGFAAAASGYSGSAGYAPGPR